MKKIGILLVLALAGRFATAQPGSPCDTEGHRQSHFWIGDWSVFDTTGKQIGENKVDLILGECELAENWTSRPPEIGERATVPMIRPQTPGIKPGSTNKDLPFILKVTGYAINWSSEPNKPIRSERSSTA